MLEQCLYDPNRKCMHHVHYLFVIEWTEYINIILGLTFASMLVRAFNKNPLKHQANSCFYQLQNDPIFSSKWIFSCIAPLSINTYESGTSKIFEIMYFNQIT